MGSVVGVEDQIGDGVAGLGVPSDCGVLSDCGVGEDGRASGVDVADASAVGEGDEIGVAE
ncbi:MAG TPA: hypothetical protein VFH31_06865 [Pyrinomonadaceae bacterium]|nr:hypothetical protein [Pyrinomonadaceae bacterium]